MTTTDVRYTELPKSSVVAYRGGGYDGCIWEWNYAYIDAAGRFHDIFSSGVMGVTTAEDLLDLLQSDTGYDVYDMSTAKGRNRLVDRESVRGAFGVAEFFTRHDFGVQLQLRCSLCGCRASVVDSTPEC